MIAPGDAGDVVVVGRIAGAFGVRGWVRVQSFTDPPENLLEYDPWLLESSDGWRPAGRQQARSQAQGLVAELRGVQDRDAAEALKGVLIGVPSSCLPGTGSDEYYWRDLIGLSVLDLDGEPLGRVVEMLATGANDVMVVALEPGGERFDQALAAELAAQPNMVLIAGRYEGVDERVITSAVDREISIGDYVLSGGELAALVVLDAVARLLPGVLGNAASAVEESHLDGLLDYPHYTRPEIGPGGTDPVPQVLLSGDHSAVRRWRLKQALKRTFLRRPDMLASRPLSRLESELLKEVLAEL